jgi:hypothetical protein
MARIKMKRTHYLLIIFIAWHCISRVLVNPYAGWQVGWFWFGWLYELWRLLISAASAIVALGFYLLIAEVEE